MHNQSIKHSTHLDVFNMNHNKRYVIFLCTLKFIFTRKWMYPFCSGFTEQIYFYLPQLLLPFPLVVHSSFQLSLRMQMCHIIYIFDLLFNCIVLEFYWNGQGLFKKGCFCWSGTYSTSTYYWTGSARTIDEPVNGNQTTYFQTVTATW